LYELLKQKIATGEYAPHQAIPSENELQQSFDISRTTVRNVITRLVNDQLLYRVPGKGTFVTESKITAVTMAKKGIREQLEEMGYETNTNLIEMCTVQADRYLADRLLIDEGSPLYQITRVRYVNNMPFSIHTTFTVASLCPDLFKKDIEHEPLCTIQKREYGIIAKHGIETLESVVTTSQQSKYLESPRDFHVLLMGCTMYSTEEVPYEFSRVVFRGDRIKLSFNFERQNQ